MQPAIKLLKLTILIFLALYTMGCKTQNEENTMPDILPLSMPKISIQLWSVNEVIKRDFKGTLTALANMGFEGVEFAGYFGPYQDDPVGLKTLLDGLGLLVSGAHVSMRHLSDENYD
ncbi:MAG: sugar phosphate isomerase/epimerase, partial [Psychrosphaera sp.]|nr:sugar phosphate isomerase/epimerase [Psychrosphaera sp.]